MKSYLIKNARIVNEGKTTEGDLLVKNGRIEKIAKAITDTPADIIIEAGGKTLIPGLIDDQVHFREPGLTHKADIHSEARAAVAGGMTTFMEMPNTVPNTLTQELLEEKYQIASRASVANYSFFMGAGNNNLEEVLKTDPKKVCGIKIFMGSSTGNMLVDNDQVLENIFREAGMLIATHCEDEATIKHNSENYRNMYNDEVPASAHAEIRSVEACYLSSSKAIELAKKHNTRLHILHISTADETALFRNDIPLQEKRITAEVCVHHLWFTKADYERLGFLIKWNPSVKESQHRDKLWEALLDDRLDIVATDHAPHTLEEKQNNYWRAPSGAPMVQHSLNVMLESHHQGKISLEKMVEKMCHNPAILFNIKERGFIREGYWADLALVDTGHKWTVTKENLLYKCGWSPLEGREFRGKVSHTFVSGNLVYQDGVVDESSKGMRLEFNRN